MTRQNFFISSNRHKAAELAAVIPRLHQIDLDLPEVQAVDSRDVIAAKLAAARAALPTGALLVEDTALHLSCLNGFPGALIKWLLGSIGCGGIHDLCERMGDRRARAVTVIGYLPDGLDSPEYFEASLEGSVCSPRGSHGFGWDPIFMPLGQGSALAEIEEDELRLLKMRRRAAEQLASYLERRTPAAPSGVRRRARSMPTDTTSGPKPRSSRSIAAPKRGPRQRAHR